MGEGLGFSAKGLRFRWFGVWPSHEFQASGHQAFNPLRPKTSNPKTETAKPY